MSPRFFRTIFLFLGLFAITVPVFYCNTAQQEGNSQWKNVYDTSVHYVGMLTCRGCHDSVYQSFIKTGMGQSFDYATRQKSAADFNPAHAIVYDSILDYYYKPYWNNDSLYIMEFRLEGRDTIHQRIQKINYIVGSGQHTNSHIYSMNGYLYQAPITFYTQKQKWDLAPGFEKGASSRFSRMIELECMSCHNGLPQFVSNSQNKFDSIKTGIDCERCHGPGSLHVKERLNGSKVDTSKTPDYTIINPRRLPVELQNSLCQRCHLQGIAVLKDGKTFFDFHPGMKLSEVLNVFMPQYEGAQDKMIMASHVERMMKSKCFLNSGKMSCITCHNPHISVKVTPREQYLNTCKNCHGSASSQMQCTESPEKKAAQNNDCVLCHMPHNSSIDIPHVAVTDHYIRKRPLDDTLQKKITAFLGMKCINNPNADNITIARGFIEFYERYTPVNSLLDSAINYLDKSKNIEEHENQNRDYIRVYFLQHDYQKVVHLAAQLNPATMNDAWTNYRIGESYFFLSKPDSALPCYKRATELCKYDLDFQNKYGTCLLALNRVPEALDVFNFILTENPSHISANTDLGYIYMHQGDNTKAFMYMQQVNYLDPDYEQNLINLAVWYHNNYQLQKAKQTLLHCIKKHPNNDRVRAMLEDLGG